MGLLIQTYNNSVTSTLTEFQCWWQKVYPFYKSSYGNKCGITALFVSVFYMLYEDIIVRSASEIMQYTLFNS